jgi:hypothetical protein
VIDGLSPVIVSKPADRTIVLAPGDPRPLCPNLLPEVSATDNVGIVSITQSPEAGTPLPNGYTQFVISVSDATYVARHKGLIHVIPPAESIGITSGIVPGLEKQHRYVSFGVPAIAANGTLAFKATIRSASGVTKTAIFRRTSGAPEVLVAITGESDAFTELGEPLVNSAGTIVFEAKAKGPGGRQIKGIWISKPAQPLQLLARSGGPLPESGSTETFRDFKDVSLLESGVLFVHASIDNRSASKPPRAIWQVTDGNWLLLLRTGEALTFEGTESRLIDFGFGKLLPKVGAQTRSFNSSAKLALRAALADNRNAIVRVSGSGSDVLVEPLAIAGMANSDWLNLSHPAINDAGDIVFLGKVRPTADNRIQAIGRVASGQNTAEVIILSAAEAGLPFAMKLDDPLISPEGDVVVPSHSPVRNPEISIWHVSDGPGRNIDDLEFVRFSMTDKSGETFLRHFDSIAVSNAGIMSMARYQDDRLKPILRGIVQTNEQNILLQAEGDVPPFPANSSEVVRRVDFLLPQLGVGGQTRNVNSNGQIAFRAKLSSGKTGIYVLTP